MYVLDYCVLIIVCFFCDIVDELYLLNGTFRQQIDVLVVWIVMVFGGFGGSGGFFLLE